MSSLEVFTEIGDFTYWVFEVTLESMADAPWMAVLVFGFAAFGYWMYRQAQYNKQAEADSSQIK